MLLIEESKETVSEKQKSILRLIELNQRNSNEDEWEKLKRSDNIRNRDTTSVSLVMRFLRVKKR